MPARHRDRVLVRVDRDGHAGLLPGQAPPPRLAAAVREVRVAGVGLVDPDPVPEHDALLAAVDRREDAVAPLPGGLVRHPACLHRRARRHAEPHEADEADPGRKLFPAVLEHGPREQVEPRAAAPAPVPLQPRLAPAVPGRLCRAAARARGVRSVECGGLGVGAESVLVAAAPLVHRRGELGEHSSSVMAATRAAQAFFLGMAIPIRPSAHPIGNCRQTKKPGGRLGNFLVGEAMVSRDRRNPARVSPVI